MDQDLVLYESRPRTPVVIGVIFTLWAAILAAILAGCVCRVAGRRAGSRASAGGSSASLLQGVRNFFSDVGLSEETKATVNQRMRALKLWRLRLFLHAVSVMSLQAALEALPVLARGSGPERTTPAEDIMWLIFVLFSAVMFVRPSLVNTENMDVITVFIMASASLLHTPLACCTEVSVRKPTGAKFLMMYGLILAGGVGTRWDWLLLGVGNTIFYGLSIYMHWHIYRREGTWVDSIVNYLFPLLATVVLFALATGYSAFERKILTQGLQLAEVREMHKAATALLRSSYDVLVELDSTGAVEGTSQELGSLLLRDNHNRSMQGVELASLFVDEDDRKTFQHRLSAPRSKTVGLAENMHVSMKDSLGNTLRMEMMWFACERAQGLNHFVVGIREFSDQAQAAPGSGPGAGQGHGRGNIRAEDYFPVPLPVTSEGSSSSEDARSMPQAAAVNLNVDAAQAMMVVDLTSADRTIRGVSTGFRSSIGHVPRNAPLSRIVRRPQHMMKWMDSSVNSVVNGDPLPEDCSVTLQLPQGRIRACCRLLLAEVEDADAEAPPMDFENVVVLLYNVSQPRPRSVPSSSSHQGTPAVANARGTPASAHVEQHPSTSAQSPAERVTGLTSI